jgi:hypothetical protein
MAVRRQQAWTWTWALGLIGLSAQASAAPAASVAPACDAHDNVGALFWQMDSGETSLLCSGVLLADDVVLTAAHCLVSDERGGLREPGQLLFVLGETPFPTRSAPQFVGYGATVSPGFSLRRVLTSPLYARAAEGKEEENALAAIEQRCGRRDANRFAELEWLGCLLQQSPELRRAVGLHDRGAGDNDVGLLFLQPNEARARSGERPLPLACDVRRHLVANGNDLAVPPPHAQERLGLLGYGYGYGPEDEPRHWARPLLDALFRPIRRREQVVRSVEIGKFELQLNDEASTCETDSGAGLFRLPKPRRAAQLVGIVSRRPRGGDACGSGGVATNLAAYWPWIDRSMGEACDRGQRHRLACPVGQPGTAGRPKRTTVSGPAKTDE